MSAPSRKTQHQQSQAPNQPGQQRPQHTVLFDQSGGTNQVHSQYPPPPSTQRPPYQQQPSGPVPIRPAIPFGVASIHSHPSSTGSILSNAGDPLQFYPSNYGNYAVPVRQSPTVGPPSLSANIGYGGGVMPTQPVSWLAAFGTGGIQDELPLLQELEINTSHIQSKTISVLNPFQTIDKHIMDDTDLMGPLLFCLLFGLSLLLSGKVHFGFIYGVALLGWISIWGILNLMSEHGIDTLRAASVLGYCLLPMVILSCLSIVLPLQYAITMLVGLLLIIRLICRGIAGLILGSASVLWCTITSSNMFVTALSMKDQRVLVAYPVGLFYTCFALMTVF